MAPDPDSSPQADPVLSATRKDIMAMLPEGHVVRSWWEARLPELPEGIDWPLRPTMAALDTLRERVDNAQKGALLRKGILDQYSASGMAPPTRTADIGLPECRTVTTGHQLCIGGGPAFTFHKIQSAITLADRLERRWGTPVVPVFWLASEDHDFEEVSRLWDGKGWLEWQPEGPIGGPVGRMGTAGLDEVLGHWKAELGMASSGIGEAASPGWTLSERMRRWVHRVFGPDRVVVVDGDHPAFKQAFIPIMAREIEEGMVHREVQRCNAGLESAGHRPQVHVRPCNLFHLGPDGRHRLEQDGKTWRTAVGGSWADTDALLRALEERPSDFSPNALLRPVYQSFLMPDVALVGGMAEVAYGLQLPAVYACLGWPQPALVPRDGALILPAKWSALMDRCGVEEHELHAPLSDWQRKVVDAAEKPDLQAWRRAMQEQSDVAMQAFARLDPSLTGSVKAAMAKMEGQLERLEQQAAKAIRRKEEEALHRMERLHAWVHPEGRPQERVAHFLHLESEWERGGSQLPPLGVVLASAFDEGHGAEDWCPLWHVLRASWP